MTTTRPRCGSSLAVSARAPPTLQCARVVCGDLPGSSGPNSPSCGAAWWTCPGGHGDDIGDYASALSTVLRTPAKSILALRDGEFLAPAVVPVSGEPVREPLRCRPDAAYLITGGMGALGLLMADWLADRGARRLVLAGRTPLPPRRDWDSDANDADVRHKIAAIRALEMRGVTVDAVALDVGSRRRGQALLAGRDDNGEPPIRGVIHAAGVTEGQLLTEIEDSRLRRTMWPKISGAQALHEAFPPSSLDFLFLTSSAGAVFGIPGQGAYAAANAYLDGLARARHRQGCHTVSLDWVAWRGLGFATDAHVVLQELERLGSRPVVPAEAFPAWEYVATLRHRSSGDGSDAVRSIGGRPRVGTGAGVVGDGSRRPADRTRGRAAENPRPRTSDYRKQASMPTGRSPRWA